MNLDSSENRFHLKQEKQCETILTKNLFLDMACFESIQSIVEFAELNEIFEFVFSTYFAYCLRGSA